MSTYAASVSRGEKFWLITVTRDGATFGLTQARNVAEIEHMARDLVATILDAPADSIDLTITYPPEIVEVTRKAAAARETAQEAATISEETARRAARYLVSRGVSVRDAAALMRISPSQVSVLSRGAA